MDLIFKCLTAIVSLFKLSSPELLLLWIYVTWNSMSTFKSFRILRSERISNIKSCPIIISIFDVIKHFLYFCALLILGGLKCISQFLAHFHNLNFQIFNPLIFLSSQKLQIIILWFQSFELAALTAVVVQIHLLQLNYLHMQLTILFHNSFIFFF